MPYGKGSYTPNDGGKKGVPTGEGNIITMSKNQGTPNACVGTKSVKNNSHGKNVSIGKK